MVSMTKFCFSDLMQSINLDTENELKIIEDSLKKIIIVSKRIRHVCHEQMVSYGC